MTGKQFKEVITQRGLKQTYIAQQIGVYPSDLSKFLNGKLNLNKSKIARLADLLKVDLFSP